MRNINSVFYLPKIVYNMSANSSGDIIGLSNPLVQDKYGDIFKKPSSDYMGNNIDVVSRLLSIGVCADNIEDNKLSISKDGVNIEIELVDRYTKVNNIISQIVFLLREIRKEQEEALERTMKSIVESNQQWGIWYE